MALDKAEVNAIIRSLLSASSTPLSVSDLNKEFKRETGVNIPRFGYDNISAFLQSLPETVKVTGTYPAEIVTLVLNNKSGHIKLMVDKQKNGRQEKKVSSLENTSKKTNCTDRYTQTDSRLLYGRKRRGYRSGQRRPQQRNRNISRPQRPVFFKKFYPKQELCFKEKVAKINLEHYTSVGTYTEIHVSAIRSPNKFYFQLREFKKTLELFMHDIQIFYETEKEFPVLSEHLIVAHQMCVAQHETDDGRVWKRAEIRMRLHDSQVAVQFIDSGEKVYIHRSNLKFLHKKFLSFPRQACLGFLANISPKNGIKWSDSAIKRFSALAIGKDLMAGVVFLNVEYCCMGVALSSTHKEEIHINDTLVAEGFANFKFSAPKSKSTFTSFEEDVFPNEPHNYIDWSKLTNQDTCYNDFKWFTFINQNRNSQRLSGRSLLSVTSFPFAPMGNASAKSNAQQFRIFYESDIMKNNERLKRMFYNQNM